MKKKIIILSVIAFFIVMCSFSMTINISLYEVNHNDTIPYNKNLSSYGYVINRLLVDSVFVVPNSDTVFGTDVPRVGSLVYRTVGGDSTLYVRYPTRWVKVGTSGGLQTLTKNISGDSIILSGGGEVSDNDKQQLMISNDTLYLTNSIPAILNFLLNSSFIDSLNNHRQLLTFNTTNDSLTISNGNSVYVPSAPVLSVNGKTGNVILTTDSIQEGYNNLYFTPTRVRASIFGSNGILFNTATGTISPRISSSYGNSLSINPDGLYVTVPSDSEIINKVNIADSNKVFTTPTYIRNQNFLTAETDPIANAKTVTLNSGTGISVQGNTTQTVGSNPSFTINAQNTQPQWNANQLQGYPLSNVTPVNGQVLQLNGGVWVPTTQSDTSAKFTLTFSSNFGNTFQNNPITGTGTIYVNTDTTKVGTLTALKDTANSISSRINTKLSINDTTGNWAPRGSYVHPSDTVGKWAPAGNYKMNYDSTASTGYASNSGLNDSLNKINGINGWLYNPATKTGQVDSTKYSTINNVNISIKVDTVKTIAQLETYNKLQNVNTIIVTDSLRGGLFTLQNSTGLVPDSCTIFPSSTSGNYWVRQRNDPNTYLVTWAGASPSQPAYNNRIAIQETINAASKKSNFTIVNSTVIVPQIYNNFANYLIDSTITVPPQVNFIMDGQVYYSFSTPLPAVIIGNSASYNHRSNYKINILGYENNNLWASNSIGVEVINSGDCRFDIKYISGFQTGVFIMSKNGNDNIYNHYTIGLINNCQYGIHLKSDNTSAITDNLFYGGNITVNPNMQNNPFDTLNQYGIVMDSGYIAGNIFNNLTVQLLQSYKKNNAVSIPILINGNDVQNNIFKHSWFESNNRINLKIFPKSGSDFNSVYVDNYYPYPADTTNTATYISDSSFNGNNNVFLTNKSYSVSPVTTIYNSGYLVNGVSPYNSTSSSVKGLSFIDYTTGAVTINSATITELNGGLEFLNPFGSFLVNTNIDKNFNLYLGIDSTMRVNLYIIAYDSLGNVINPFHSQTIYSSQITGLDSVKFGGKGNMFSPGIYDNSILFSVASSVKKIRVIIGNTRPITNIQLLSYDGKTTYGYSDYDTLNNIYGISQTLPTQAYPSGTWIKNDFTNDTTAIMWYKKPSGWYPLKNDTTLKSLSDVSIISPISNQLLQWNGTNWINWTPDYLKQSDFTDSLKANSLDVLFPLSLNATNKTLSADTTMKDSSLVNYRQMKQYVGINSYVINNINVSATGLTQLLSIPLGGSSFILTRIEIVQTSPTGTNTTISIGYTSPNYSDFFSGTFGMVGQYNTAIPTLSGNLGIPSGDTLQLNITSAGTGTIAILIEGFYL